MTVVGVVGVVTVVGVVGEVAVEAVVDAVGVDPVLPVGAAVDWVVGPDPPSMHFTVHLNPSADPLWS